MVCLGYHLNFLCFAGYLEVLLCQMSRLLYDIVINLMKVGEVIQCDSFGTRPKKMRISEKLFIRF